MTKKGKSGPRKHYVRLAVVGGAAVGAVSLGTGQGHVTDIIAAPKGSRMRVAAVVADGIAKSPGEAAVSAGVPVVGGAVISVGADKLGVNKALAKAHMPFRI